VQAILAIELPKGVKQLRHFLGMVQYYHDIWARWSNMLAPLTSFVGECGPSEEQNFDLEKLISIRVWYVHADPINFI